MGNMRNRSRKFNRVKKNSRNKKGRSYYLDRERGKSNPLIGLQYKLHHIEVILGYKKDKDGEFDDTWQAMSPKEIQVLEAERKRLIEILTPSRLEYNKKHFSKTFHTE